MSDLTLPDSTPKNITSEAKAKRPRGTGSVFQMKGSANWWIAYHRGGKLVRESSKSDKVKTAEGLLKQRIGEIANHTWISPRDRRVTVDELYASLLADYRNNGMASFEGAAQRWEWKREDEETPRPGRLKKFFGGMLALAVTTAHLEKYVDLCRFDGLSNATINRDLSALRRAFTLAHRGKRIQEVPFFPHLKEAAPRQGFVEEADYDRLCRHTEALWLRGMLAVAYAFGLRAGELQELRVRQVDLAERMIRLNAGETKNGAGRIAPMTQDVHTLLAACVSGKKPDDYVFTRENGRPIRDLDRTWKALAASAGIPGLLFHDLRRSAARNMIRRGIPEVVAMRISGHKTRSVFDRYNIVSESDLREAARKIDAGRRVHTEFVQSLAPETDGRYTN